MSQAPPRTAYYASRPRLRVDGRPVEDLGDVLLQSLLVEETTLGFFRCEASFRNWGTRNREVGYLFFNDDLLDFGKTLSVEFGPPGAAGPGFAGRIILRVGANRFVPVIYIDVPGQLPDIHCREVVGKARHCRVLR